MLAIIVDILTVFAVITGVIAGFTAMVWATQRHEALYDLAHGPDYEGVSYRKMRIGYGIYARKVMTYKKDYDFLTWVPSEEMVPARVEKLQQTVIRMSNMHDLTFKSRNNLDTYKE